MAEELRKLRNGERITGIVIAVNQSEAIVDLGLKLTGIIPAEELDPIKKSEEVVKIGDELELVVMKVSDMDGIVTLSKIRADAQKDNRRPYQNQRSHPNPSDDVLQEIRDMRREMQLMMNDMHYTLQSIHALCEEIKNQKK